MHNFALFIILHPALFCTLQNVAPLLGLLLNVLLTINPPVLSGTVSTVWDSPGLSGSVWDFLGLSVGLFIGLSGTFWDCLGLSGTFWDSL